VKGANQSSRLTLKYFRSRMRGVLNKSPVRETFTGPTQQNHSTQAIESIWIATQTFIFWDYK